MRSEKGSILVLSLVVAGTVGFVAGTFLRSLVNESKLAQLDFYNASAVQLTDAGGETGILALNSDDWTNWTVSGTEAVRTLPEFAVGGGKTGEVTVKVIDIDTEPYIISEAKIKVDAGVTVRRQVEYDLRPRSIFANAVTAGGYVYFYRGNSGSNTVKVDSYDSARGSYDGFFNRSDGGTIASDSVFSYRLSKAEIYGYVSTNRGRGRNNPPSVGIGGKIYGPNTPSWVNIDEDRLSRDFRATFVDLSPPAIATATRLSNARTIELGSGTTREFIRISGDLNIASGRTLRIVGNVVLVVGDDFWLDGRLEIQEPFGQLTLYIADDLRSRNDGIINYTGDPQKLVIISTETRPNRSRFFFMGDADLHAAIYAPHSYVDFIGDGTDGKTLRSRGGRSRHFSWQL